MEGYERNSFPNTQGTRSIDPDVVNVRDAPQTRPVPGGICCPVDRTTVIGNAALNKRVLLRRKSHFTENVAQYTPIQANGARQAPRLPAIASQVSNARDTDGHVSHSRLSLRESSDTFAERKATMTRITYLRCCKLPRIRRKRGLGAIETSSYTDRVASAPPTLRFLLQRRCARQAVTGSSTDSHHESRGVTSAGSGLAGGGIPSLSCRRTSRAERPKTREKQREK